MAKITKHGQKQSQVCLIIPIYCLKKTENFSGIFLQSENGPCY